MYMEEIMEQISHNSLVSHIGQDGPIWIKPIEEEAYYGLAGNIVRTIEPHSEADPVALLLQLLACVGNVIGNKTYFKVEDDMHSLKINPIMVGRTSKARKGISWSRIRGIFEQIDPEWVKNHLLSGLASGEGLIYAASDQHYISSKIALGKRLLIIEPEFASTLKIISKEGNILSGIIRQSWDGTNLGNLTKGNPLRASDTHITIIGHVTIEELRRYLTKTEIANGFGNRHLWVCVRRSKLLPEGGALSKKDLEPYIKKLREAITFSYTVNELRRDEEANAFWRELYPILSEEIPGITGALLARSEAYVMRIACIFAILDCSAFIRIGHLKAALAIWHYIEASVSYVFGDALGNPLGDAILAEIRMTSGGLSRTAISNIFERHRKSAEISEALSLLKKLGLAESYYEPTKGRPIEKWFAIAKKAN